MGAAVKPSDRNESEPVRALPGYYPLVRRGLVTRAYPARGPVAIHEAGSFLRRRAHRAFYVGAARQAKNHWDFAS